MPRTVPPLSPFTWCGDYHQPVSYRDRYSTAHYLEAPLLLNTELCKLKYFIFLSFIIFSYILESPKSSCLLLRLFSQDSVLVGRYYRAHSKYYRKLATTIIISTRMIRSKCNLFTYMDKSQPYDDPFFFLMLCYYLSRQKWKIYTLIWKNKEWNGMKWNRMGICARKRHTDIWKWTFRWTQRTYCKMGWQRNA